MTRSLSPHDLEEAPPDADPVESDAIRHRGVVRVAYRSSAGRTRPERIQESGPLRVRHPRAPSCEAVLINTGGGIVGGDRLDIDVALGPDAAVTLTSVAAEKVYRTSGAVAHVTTRLALAERGSMLWLPQETILFDRSKFRRRFEVDLAAHARFVSAEIVVFGRAASGEARISGVFRESWRVRCEGRLLYADETSIEGPITDILARPAVANGARAVATLLVAGPSVASGFEAVREALAQASRDGGGAGQVEAGASLRRGIIIARLLGHSAMELRIAVASVIRALGDAARMPRSWS